MLGIVSGFPQRPVCRSQGCASRQTMVCTVASAEIAFGRVRCPFAALPDDDGRQSRGPAYFCSRPANLFSQSPINLSRLPGPLNRRQISPFAYQPAIFRLRSFLLATMYPTEQTALTEFEILRHHSSFVPKRMVEQYAHASVWALVNDCGFAETSKRRYI